MSSQSQAPGRSNPLLRKRGHSLLEVLVATGIFILVAVAAAGVWSIYGSALSKASEVVTANQLARGVNEGLMANGFDWLINPSNHVVIVENGLTFLTGFAPPNDVVTVKRKIRSRQSDIHYSVRYRILRYDPDLFDPLFSDSVAFIRVEVRWRSDSGSKVMEDGSDYNNSVRYNSAVFRGALQ